ncbi:MAG: hypothetical protein ACHQXL_01070 [Candidatus Limnocylindrales bacterium]
MTAPPDTTPDATPASGPAADLPRRPLGVALLAAFGLFSGVQSILAGLGVVSARYGSIGSLITDHTAFQVVTVALGVIYLGSAVAVWQLWRAGWYATMLAAGVGLLLQIVLYVYGDPNFITMAIAAVAALYLNQREVKAVFLRPPMETTSVVLEAATDQDP